jgi:hypothetical protein
MDDYFFFNSCFRLAWVLLEETNQPNPTTPKPTTIPTAIITGNVQNGVGGYDPGLSDVQAVWPASFQVIVVVKAGLW